MAAMHFEQVQRFILAEKIIWGLEHCKGRSLGLKMQTMTQDNLVRRACVTLVQRTGNGCSGIIQNRNHQIMVPV